MSNSKYIEIDYKEIKHLFNGDLILVVTATDLETRATHEKIKPLKGQNKILKVFEGDLTYYFGLLGNYKVAHVQSSMGSLSRNGSIMTISTALKELNSRIVIAVGIAFGVDEEKQNIGDVLISESVIPYNAKRVGKHDTIQRGIEAPSSKILLSRFKSIKTTWEFFLTDKIKANLIPTRLLSGEELVDNLEYRDILIKDNPDSMGGEMEAAGVYAACDGKADWIIVKGICDFADGKKGVDKEHKQSVAMNSALSACMEIFNSNSAFNEFKILSLENSIDSFVLQNLNINEVLFDLYDSTKEKHYIERECDNIFNQIIKQYGIWVYGPSGCGKSNLISRNLTKNKTQFIQINLAPCIGQDIESFFKEILYEVASTVEGVHSQIQPQTFAECSKALIALLNKHFNDKELLIFIEEIPVSTSKSHREFCEKIFALVISKNFISGLDKIKFVLSSIDNPKFNIPIVQHKIHQNMSFLSLGYWEEGQIILLIDMILREFKISLTGEFKSELIQSAKGSPRFIKKFFRSIYTLNKADEKTLKMVLKETERELSLNNYA
jgi:nucleoside phosphorylase